MNEADRQDSNDPAVNPPSRPPVGRILFGLGSFFFLAGYALTFCVLKGIQQKSPLVEKVGKLPIGMIFLGLFFWVLAPFFGNRSLVFKIVMSVGMVIFWSVAGDVLVWIINHAAGVSG